MSTCCAFQSLKVLHKSHLRHLLSDQHHLVLLLTWNGLLKMPADLTAQDPPSPLESMFDRRQQKIKNLGSFFWRRDLISPQLFEADKPLCNGGFPFPKWAFPLNYSPSPSSWVSLSSCFLLREVWCVNSLHTLLWYVSFFKIKYI